MDKAHESKDLDLTTAAKGVWLVKVPKYVSDCWKKASRGAEIGKLVFSKTKAGPGKHPEATFCLSEQLLADIEEKDGETIPAEHSFNLTGVGSQALSVLSVETLPIDTSEIAPGSAALPYMEGKVCIEGRVIHRAECRPKINDTYMKLHKSRLELGNKPKRAVISLDKAVIGFKPKTAHDADIDYEKRKKEEGKKTRDDAGIVQQALFCAFEKHQYYNIKDLVSITRQPVAYLKEILKEICIYNVKAPHKNMWELKPEFRHYESSTS